MKTGKKITEAKPAEGKLHAFSGWNIPSPDFFQYKSLQSACHMLLVILDYNLIKLDALFLFIVHCQA